MREQICLQARMLRSSALCTMLGTLVWLGTSWAPPELPPPKLPDVGRAGRFSMPGQVTLVVARPDDGGPMCGDGLWQMHGFWEWDGLETGVVLIEGYFRHGSLFIISFFSARGYY